jgi:hypothetical protein
VPFRANHPSMNLPMPQTERSLGVRDQGWQRVCTMRQW